MFLVYIGLLVFLVLLELVILRMFLIWFRGILKHETYPPFPSRKLHHLWTFFRISNISWSDNWLIFHLHLLFSSPNILISVFVLFHHLWTFFRISNISTDSRWICKHILLFHLDSFIVSEHFSRYLISLQIHLIPRNLETDPPFPSRQLDLQHS